MLDDRLTSAGNALRNAPMPPIGLHTLDRRRRQRAHRRLAVAALAVLAVVAVGLARHDPAPIRVMDDSSRVVRVPAAKAPAQLVPRALPTGWRQTGSSESPGMTLDIPLHLYAKDPSVRFASSPYIAVLDLKESYQGEAPPPVAAVTVGGMPGLLVTEPSGLRRLTFKFDGGPSTLAPARAGSVTFTFDPGLPSRAVSVFGWKVSDTELRRVAASIRPLPQGLAITHVPNEFRRVLTGTAAFEPRPLERIFDYRSGHGTLQLRSSPTGTKRLTKLLWQHPGTTIIRRAGRTVARSAVDGGFEWRWLEGGSTLTLRGIGTSDAEMTHFVASLRSRPTSALAPYADPYLAGTQSRFRVPYLDDRFDGHHFLLWAQQRRRWGGAEAACFDYAVNNGDPCLAPPHLDGTHAIRPWLPDAGGVVNFGVMTRVATYAVRDDVATVAVRYRGAATRVITPVRIDPGLPRAAGVVQPEGRRVDSIEARDRKGRVLGVVRSPFG